MATILDINKNKYILIGIPKTGCKSLVYLLKDFQIEYLPLQCHCGYNYIKKNYNDTDYKYIVTIRNPWDRMVSYYHYLRQNNGLYSEFYTLSSMVKHISFFEYVDIIISGDNFFKTELQIMTNNNQWSFITNNKNEVVVDYVFKLENIQNDISEFLKNNGIEDRTILKLNTSKRGHYREYYNDEYIDKVYQFDKELIEKYNYTY